MEKPNSVIDPIPFRPRPRSSRRFGVSIKYFEGNEEQPGKRLDYQMKLSIQQYRDVPNTWQFCLNKEELFVNQHEPDLVAEQLASRAMKVLYPIKVDVNAQNEPIRGIVNHGEIIERWIIEKENILNKYEGDFLETFIDKMEKKIASKSEIEVSLQYDMFWSVFFHPQYAAYGQNKTKKAVFDFPIIPYATYRFTGEQVLSDFYTEYGTYQVSFEAVEKLPKTFEKFGPGANMKLSAQFDLDQTDGILKHSVVNWGIYSQDGQVCHKRTRFSAYEIEDLAAKTATLDPARQEPDQTTAPKKGFWERILG